MTQFRPQWIPSPRAWWVVPVLLLMTIPGTIQRTRDSDRSIANHAYPWSLDDGEVQALNFLQSDPRAGGVLADDYAGLLIPPFTGRETYIGPFSWTPAYNQRLIGMSLLENGRFSPHDAQSFLKLSGARFIFTACHGRANARRDISRELGPLLQAKHVFGCARVYVIKPTYVTFVKSNAVGGPGS